MLLKCLLGTGSLILSHSLSLSLSLSLSHTHTHSGHPGLWLDESFYRGASYSCSTFDNECLASNEDFICSGVEAWGFL